MSLDIIITDGVIAGSGSIAMSGECYVRATNGVGGIRVATVPVWSAAAEIGIGNVENYSMPGSMIRLSSSVATGCSIGGISENYSYDDKLLINVNPNGGGSITLKHNSSGSTATNRFSLPGASGLFIHPYLSPSGSTVRVVYDPVEQRWKALTNAPR